MKILDLLEKLIDPNVESKKFGGTLKHRDIFRRSRYNNKKEIGKGTHSSVKDDPRDPHMVVKNNTQPYSSERSKDGFAKFVEFLIDSDLLDNIHFPKVYNIKRITDQDRNFIYAYRLEKLYDMDILSLEELNAIRETHLKDIPEFTSKGNGIEDIAAMTGEALSYGDFSYLRGSYAKDLKLLHDWFKENQIKLGLKEDLIYKNIMVRKTPYGNQLVLSDPFF